VKRLVTEGIIPLEIVVPDIPEPVHKLVGRMLSRDRALRPSDLREVWETLLPYSTVMAPSFNPAVSERPFPDIEGRASPSTPQAVVVSRPSSDPRADTESSSDGGARTDSPQSVSVQRRRQRGRSSVLVVALGLGVALVATIASLAGRGPAPMTSTGAAAGVSVIAPVAAIRTSAMAPAPAAPASGSSTPVVELAKAASAEPARKESGVVGNARTKGKRDREPVVAAVSSAGTAAPAPSTSAKPAPTNSPGLIDDLPF